MATSGSKDFNLTVGDLINGAIRSVGGKPAVGISSQDTKANARQALNMILKHWQGEGIDMWMLRGIYIFLSDGGYEYNLGPSGKLAYSMTKTELGADAASGAVEITVDSITGVSDGDYLGIELDDGTLQWTTVSGSPVGTEIVPSDALEGAASTDNHVYAFTSLADRPISLFNVRLVDTDGDETELNEIALQEYQRYPDKDSDGLPSQWSYDKQLTNGVLRIFPAASDVKYYLRADAKIEIDDLDSLTEDLELPKQFYRALKFALASDIKHEYMPDTGQAEIWVAKMNDIDKKADRYKNEIAGFEGEEASLIFDYQ